MANIDLIVLTYNEENNLANCLRSVHGLVTNIFIVDSGSSDRTVQIAESFGARVVTHPFVNQAQQFNWSLDNLPLESDWILRLDADEYLLPELAREMGTVLPASRPEVTGYYMRRRMIFLGRWIKNGGYYPVWLLRAFRRGCARSEEVELNEHIILTTGRAERLQNDFVDHDHDGVRSWLTKHEGYAVRYARMIRDIESRRTGNIGTSPFATQERRKRWILTHVYLRMPLFVRPFGYFLYRYFVRLGFLDGIPGLIFHTLQGFWYHFYVDVCLYEMRRTSLRASR